MCNGAPCCSQISIVELEKSQRQQELLQLKSYGPCDGSPYRKGLDPRQGLDPDPSKLLLSSGPALNGLGAEVNGGKGDLLTRYLPAIAMEHEATPNGRAARHLGVCHALPDYTRFSPAKIALRRHLNQDSSLQLRGMALATHRLVGDPTTLSPLVLLLTE